MKFSICDLQYKKVNKVAKWVSASELTSTSIQANKVEIEYLVQACFGLSKLKDLQMSRMQNKTVFLFDTKQY